jgi:hypothetical protein
VNTYESTTVVVAILQLLISGLGFVVVAWTLRVLVRQIDAQSSAGVATRQLEFDKVILEHPCLYRYFYQDQDIAPNDPEYTRVMAATQLLANYFDGYFQQEGMYRQMWPDIKWKLYPRSRRKEFRVASLRGRELYMVRSRVCSDVPFTRALVHAVSFDNDVPATP